MQIKREVKILTLFLSMVYAVCADAQSQPQANGSGYEAGTGAGSVSATRTMTNTVSSTTNMMSTEERSAKDATTDPSAMQQTAPGDITTVNPMDPVNDSRRTTDSQMLDLRRKGKAAVPAVSGAIETKPIY